MLKFLEETILSFRSLFKRERSFKWFAVLILSFILRDDHLGVTSAIRALLLPAEKYDAMLHNLRSDGYTNESVRKHWYTIVRGRAPFLRVKGKIVLAGDDVKQSKEGRRMPGVKKLHQESEDSSKGEYIFGHMFGAVGAVISNGRQSFCLPLKMRIHDGLKEAASWAGSTISAETSVLQMINDGCEAAQTLGASILVLDRYFLSVPALMRMKELNDSAGGELLSIVTKAKKNIKTYLKPVPPPEGCKKRGRPRLKGDPVRLRDLFGSEDFIKAKAVIYGQESDVEYLVRDLLWGQRMYRELRFVLVKCGDSQSILVSTDLTLDPVDIIELYSHRFSIEHFFREFKQQIGGFCYHFWCKSLDKLNHFKKHSERDNLANVEEKSVRQKILKAVDATERYVMIGHIAMGLLQMIILQEQDPGRILKMRYLRTVREGKLSEATLIYYLQRTLLLSLAARPHSRLNQYIQQARNEGFGSKSSA